MGFTGFYWVLLGLTGFNWVLLGFTRFYKDISSFTGLLLLLSGCTEFFRFPQAFNGFTGFYRYYKVLKGIAGFDGVSLFVYCVLPSFTEFYQVLLGFTEFSCFLLVQDGLYWDGFRFWWFTGFYWVFI